MMMNDDIFVECRHCHCYLIVCWDQSITPE